MMRRPANVHRVSVVVVCLNEGANTALTVANLTATLPEDSEIVVVDDGSTDGGPAIRATSNRVRVMRTNQLGVAAARNYGAAQASGDVLIFADAHIAVPPRWWRDLVHALENPRVGAVAPAVSDSCRPGVKGFGLRFADAALHIEWLAHSRRGATPVPILPGCCLAMRRSVFEATGGFDSGLVRWGETDNELSVRLWLLGYELRIIPHVVVTHLFRGRQPYTVRWKEVIHNKLRLACVHFDEQRIAAVVDAVRDHPAFPDALAMLATTDISNRRAALAGRRVNDDKWFFDRFGEWRPEKASLMPSWRVFTASSIAVPRAATM
jgi:GT2 family glycosyltransferase